MNALKETLLALIMALLVIIAAFSFAAWIDVFITPHGSTAAYYHRYTDFDCSCKLYPKYKLISNDNEYAIKLPKGYLWNRDHNYFDYSYDYTQPVRIVV